MSRCEHSRKVLVAELPAWCIGGLHELGYIQQLHCKAPPVWCMGDSMGACSDQWLRGGRRPRAHKVSSSRMY